MASKRHRRLTAQAAKRRIREGRMWYQRRRRGEVVYNLFLDMKGFRQGMEQIAAAMGKALRSAGRR
jgi:hypothetical protein